MAWLRIFSSGRQLFADVNFRNTPISAGMPSSGVIRENLRLQDSFNSDFNTVKPQFALDLDKDKFFRIADHGNAAGDPNSGAGYPPDGFC